MNTRSSGPGERLVLEPYTKEVYDETLRWLAAGGIFDGTATGPGTYETPS
jgi:hypothetical protein